MLPTKGQLEQWVIDAGQWEKTEWDRAVSQIKAHLLANHNAQSTDEIGKPTGFDTPSAPPPVP